MGLSLPRACATLGLVVPHLTRERSRSVDAPDLGSGDPAGSCGFRSIVRMTDAVRTLRLRLTWRMAHARVSATVLTTAPGPSSSQPGMASALPEGCPGTGDGVADVTGPIFRIDRGKAIDWDSHLERGIESEASECQRAACRATGA